MHPFRKKIFPALGFFSISLCPIFDEPAYAHTILEFYNPYYLIGAAAAVILSFVIFSLFWKHPSLAESYPRYDLLEHKAFVTILSSGKQSLRIVEGFSVFCLFLIIATGMAGSQEQRWNITPLFFWFGIWFGLALMQILGGNVWHSLNPWRISFEWVERAFYRGRRKRAPLFSYPRGLGVWPAFFLFLSFAWFESIHPLSQSPGLLSQLVIAYSLITWCAMYLFGKNVWLSRGEFISVVFSLFSQLSPTEAKIRDENICRSCPLDCRKEGGECIDCYECYSQSTRKEFNLRPYGVGLLRSKPTRVGEMMVILLLLAGGMFKGLMETYAWKKLWLNLGIQLDLSEYALWYNTLGFFCFFLLVVGVYFGFSYLIKIFSNSGEKIGEVALFFIPSLLPVATVFHFAHKFEDFAENIQQFYKILSDPFGFGWNLFGTRLHSVVRPDLFWVWHGQVLAVIIAHVFAVYFAHILALRFYGDSGVAIKSQIPMLALMVTYTVSGLWILSTIPQVA